MKALLYIVAIAAGLLYALRSAASGAAEGAKLLSEPITPIDVPKFSALDRLSPAFVRGLIAGLQRIGMDPIGVLAVIQHETGGHTRERRAENWIDGKLVAAGLIQFLGSTAQKLGTTTADIAKMSDVEQLPYVLAFYERFGARAFPSMKGRWTPAQTLRLTFYPSSVGKDPSYVIAKKDDRPSSDDPAEVKRAKFSALVYAQNAGMDRNKDGLITASDVDGDAERIVSAARARGMVHYG